MNTRPASTHGSHHALGRSFPGRRQPGRLTRRAFLQAVLQAGAVLALAPAWSGCAHLRPRQEQVVFETRLGAITVAVDVQRAPVTTANFLKYVDAGFYNGGVVNRAVRADNTVRHDVEIQVIQFQVDPAREESQLPPIPLERTSLTGLRHRDGTLSMARNGPDTAQGSFSIVLGDQPEMDYGGRRNPDGQGFAAFGRVVAVMDVVHKIHQSPTGASGPYGTESLVPPVPIVRAYRKSLPAPGR